MRDGDAFCVEGLTCDTAPDTEAPQPSTPLAQEVLENLNRYPHCILLTRVGQFYEVHYDVYDISRIILMLLSVIF